MPIKLARMPASREELEKLLQDHREGTKQQLMTKAKKAKMHDERIKQMLQNRRKKETYEKTSDDEVGACNTHIFLCCPTHCIAILMEVLHFVFSHIISISAFAYC